MWVLTSESFIIIIIIIIMLFKAIIQGKTSM